MIFDKVRRLALGMKWNAIENFCEANKEHFTISRYEYPHVALHKSREFPTPFWFRLWRKHSHLVVIDVKK